MVRKVNVAAPLPTTSEPRPRDWSGRPRPDAWIEPETEVIEIETPLAGSELDVSADRLDRVRVLGLEATRRARTSPLTVRTWTVRRVSAVRARSPDVVDAWTARSAAGDRCITGDGVERERAGNLGHADVAADGAHLVAAVELDHVHVGTDPGDAEGGGARHRDVEVDARTAVAEEARNLRDAARVGVVHLDLQEVVGAGDAERLLVGRRVGRTRIARLDAHLGRIECRARARIHGPCAGRACRSRRWCG